MGLPVLSGWLCFRLGSSLKHHSPSARWMAVFLLAAACVPPLTLVFQAFWGRVYGMAAGTFAIAAIPASFALVLSASASDALFTAGYKSAGPWFARRRRGLTMLLGVVAVAGTAYIWATARHSKALALVAAAKQQIARSDWLAAVQSLDAALHADSYVSSEAYLLRGTAINGAISTNGTLPSGHDRRDALADLEWFLKRAPNSGEAHYQRGCALAGLAEVKQALAAFARAIPLLSDPTDALVDHAALSFHVFDYTTAARLMTLAIERRPLIAEYYEQRSLYRTFLRDFRARISTTPEPSSCTSARTPSRSRRSKRASTTRVISLSPGPRTHRPCVPRSPGLPATGASSSGSPIGERPTIRRLEPSSSSSTKAIYRSFGTAGVLLIGTYRIEPDDARQWVRIDLTRPLDGRASTMRGVYNIRGDVLRLCVADEGGPRPAAFGTKGLYGVTLFTMKRASQ